MNKNTWLEVAKTIYNLQQEIKRKTEEQKELLQSLVHLSNNETTALKGFKLNEITAKGAVRYKDIPELKDVDLELYRGESKSYWKLTYTAESV